MKRKYFIMGGKKIYLEEEATEGATSEETPEDVASEGATSEETPEDVATDEEAEEIKVEEKAKLLGRKIAEEAGSHIAEKIIAKLDIQKKGSYEKISPKIREIIGNKDLTKDVDTLTKEEKIVGFFNALVHRDMVTVKALSEGTAADGGYLFPDEFHAELVRELANFTIMRPLVRVINMTRDVMKIPTLVDGPHVAWTEENATKSTTTAHFYEATLTAYKQAAILYASDELIEDSTYIDVVNTIITLFAERLADEEDKAILQGSGTGQPTGIATAITATTIPNVACVGLLDFDDIINLIYALNEKYRRNASFIIANRNVRDLRKVKDSNNRYIWQDAVAPGQPATIYGYPVYVSDYIGEGTIAFGDWKRCYWVGDRKQMTVKISNDTETAFTKDQTAIRVVRRIAGNVVLGNAARGLTGV